MGTWGAGNFDNDSALDYVGDLVYEMQQKVDDILADEDRRARDEEGEGVLMPTIVVMSLLYEHCTAPAPDLEKVRSWKKRYLAVYDEDMEDYDLTPGFKEERRQVIEETFAKLEAQAQEFEQAAT